MKLSWPIVFLIGANLIPIVGVVFLGWSVGNILALYWLESVIIGVLNIAKILSCQGGPRQGLMGKVFLSLFFAMHYGMFTAVHGVFLDELLLEDGFSFAQLRTDQAIRWTGLGFVVSHSVSMLINFFGRGEYLTCSPHSQMFMPYGRVVVMHIVIIFGGFLVVQFGAPIWALFVLIAVKVIIDLYAHKRSHKKESVAS